MNLAGVLLYDCAMRRQDLLRLSYQDFLDENNAVGKNVGVSFYCQKQDKIRSVTVSAAIRELVREQMARDKPRKGEEPVTKRSKIFRYCSITKFAESFSHFLKRNTEDEVMTHDFRTSKVTQMYAETGDISAISAFLGHKSTQITWGYVKEVGKQIWRAK